jgi:hypothetical protein
MSLDPSASRVAQAASRPISRRWHALAVGALALAAVVNAWEWFDADRMPGGDFPGYAAQIQYVRDALLRHGRVPLWCTGCYGGTTNFTGHLKEYLAFPFAVWGGPVLAGKLLFSLARFAAALGLYGVVARLFAAPGVGLVAGYAYGFGALANHQGEHLDVAVAAALYPPILLAGAGMLRRGSARPACAFGVLVACQLVNNWVHALPAFVALALLAALRPWRDPAGPPERPAWSRWARLLALAFAVFLAFAGSQLAWIASDARNHRLTAGHFVAKEQRIYIEWSPFLFLNRDGVLRSWLSEHHPPGLAAAGLDVGRRYLGAVVLAVCAAGGLAARRDPRLRRWAALAGLLFVFQYWLSLGPRTLLWQLAGSLHGPPEAERAVRAALLAGALACGLLALAAGLGRGRRRPGPLSRASPAGLLAAGLLLAFPTFSLWSLAARVAPVLRLQRSPGHYFDTAGFWLYLLFAIALVALARRIPRRRVAGALVAGVGLAVVADFWPSRRVFAEGLPMGPLRRARELVAALPEQASEARSRPQASGGLAAGSSPAASSPETLRLALSPEYSPLASFVAENAPVGHAWGWLRWQAGRYWADFVAAAVWSPDPTLHQAGRRRATANVPLLAAGRIRYYLVDAASGWGAPPPPWRLLHAGEPFSVWEQPRVAPVASGFRAAVPVVDEAAADLPTLVSRALRDHALVVSAPRGVELHLPGPPGPPPFPVGYRRPRPEQIALDVQAGGEPALVFVSEGYHPWWRATVDGEPAPLWRAQIAFMAVAVGTGSHAVELAFERPGWLAAADRASAAAWIALFLCVPGAWLARRLRGRRRGGA